MVNFGMNRLGSAGMFRREGRSSGGGHLGVVVHVTVKLSGVPAAGRTLVPMYRREMTLQSRPKHQPVLRENIEDIWKLYPINSSGKGLFKSIRREYTAWTG